MSENLILRWSMGEQNTFTLSSFEELNKYKDYLWLAKLSVCSFQKWFPKARFVILYNGHQFYQFLELWHSILPSTIYEVEFIDQRACLKNGTYKNRYHFYPIGVWWKWVPFRLDVTKDEIAIDTDIVCISEPISWFNWLNEKTSIVVSSDRFEKIRVNTCGDLHKHPILQEKKPANCGIVGQRRGENYETEFFEISKEVRFGYTHDSMFITEQGVINLWIYSLLLKNVTHTILDFKYNAWIRDFVYFMLNGFKVETVHATSWHKEIVKDLKDVFEQRILKNCSDKDFIDGILRGASNFHGLAHTVLLKQLEPEFEPIE